MAAPFLALIAQPPRAALSGSIAVVSRYAFPVASRSWMGIGAGFGAAWRGVRGGDRLSLLNRMAGVVTGP